MPITYATAGTFTYLNAKQLAPIVAAFETIAWPCPQTRIPEIVDQLGWTIVSDRVHTKADTHLALTWPRADFAKADGNLYQLDMDVSDRVSSDDPAGMARAHQCYPLVCDAVGAIMGRPPDGACTEEGVTQTWWELPTGGRLAVDIYQKAIGMTLSSQAWADSQRFEETHDMSE